MATDTHQGRLEAFIAWYEAFGATGLVSDSTTDWFALAEQQRAARKAAQRAGGEGRGSANADGLPDQGRAGRPTPDPRHYPSARTQTHKVRPLTPDRSGDFDELLAGACERARKAASLAELREALTDYDGCGLKKTAKNLCFYRGADASPIMFIGEAPGRDEDLEGKPFVGRAGQLLDKMLASIALAEGDVHITNIVYWRPPGNRTPSPQEALACRPFLVRQIELVAPRIIVALGGAAAKHLLEATEGIMRLRGKWRSLAPSILSDLAEGGGPSKQEIQVLATLHPAYLLRTPAAKRMAWQDLLAIRRELDAR